MRTHIHHKMKNITKNKKGTTFIELLLYISIFLILTPILLTVSINSIKTEERHTIEKEISADSRFVVERVYDQIIDAKKIDALNSNLNSSNGKLTLIMQNDSSVAIELNTDDDTIEITENGVTLPLSSGSAKVESLYFEKITDNINDPDIILGVNMRMQISGIEEFDTIQNYVVSANLERGDFDGDGCPDYIDKFPRHENCCGDADADEICDELDNCVLEYNPFQEDYDSDGIGDNCDDSVFIEGDDEGGNTSGGLGVAFNCSPEDQFLALINQEPPMKSSELKKILLSASPLPPSVLMALINVHPLLTNGHFKQVFVANTKLTEDILQAVIDLDDLPVFYKVAILGADIASEIIPWLNVDRRDYVDYDITLYSDAPEGETWNNRIKFDNASPTTLGSDLQDEKTDVFIIDVENGSDAVTITIETTGGTDTNTINNENNYIVDINGYAIEYDEKIGNSYAFLISSVYSEYELISIEFNFGEGANVTDPTGTVYATNRYICYCEGGCAEDCGDVGTGIITENVFTDDCYDLVGELPEWCLRWHSFVDDNSANPAYIGGTQEDEETLYYEKTLQTILTIIQLNEVASITVGGEIAYQSITQFFCDTLSSSCPISGNLTGGQDVELFNWDTDSWEVIGSSNLDDSISDQQAFEVIYDQGDILKFFGGEDDKTMKVRMEFTWDGVPPAGSESAPSFMTIDYFTLHLKW